MNKTEARLYIIGLIKKYPTYLDPVWYDFLVLLAIKSNLNGFKRLIKNLYNADKKAFADVLSFMNNLNKTDSYQKLVSYRHAIEVFELPSWMELRSEGEI